jgi:phosphoglycerol transferase MdoB-like AlkP superfamily enzyme
METTIKKLHWQEVMTLAITLMIAGLGLSLWAVAHHDDFLAICGIVLIAIVCVSWWFWVMFVIKTLLDFYSKTDVGLVELKYGLKDIRVMIKEYESARQR